METLLYNHTGRSARRQNFPVSLESISTDITAIQETQSTIPADHFFSHSLQSKPEATQLEELHQMKQEQKWSQMQSFTQSEELN